jgi:hypothetical protein
MISEVSVCGHIASLFLGYDGEADSMVGSKRWSKAAHLMTAGKQKDSEEGARAPIFPPKACPSDLLPPPRPYLLKFPPPPNGTFNNEPSQIHNTIFTTYL